MALLTIPMRSIFDGTVFQNRIQRIPTCSGVRVSLVAGAYHEQLQIENLDAQPGRLWMVHSMWPEFRLPTQEYWSALGGVHGTSHSINCGSADGTLDFDGPAAIRMDRTVALGGPETEPGVAWNVVSPVTFTDPALLQAMSGSGPARLFGRLAHAETVQPWNQKWQLRSQLGNAPLAVPPAVGLPHSIQMSAQFLVELLP